MTPESRSHQVGEIYFTDIFTIDFNASIDPNYVRGRGSGWANATTLARPICRPTLDTNAYARCGAMTYTMYEVSTPGGCSADGRSGRHGPRGEEMVRGDRVGQGAVGEVV